MRSYDTLSIDLREPGKGPESLHFDLGSDFFEAVEADGIHGGELSVDVRVDKASGVARLDFDIKGHVILPCDLCLDDMRQPVSATAQLTARLGDEPRDDGDEVVVDRRDGLLDFSWFVYETVALAIPIKHTHADGECNPAMLRRLREHTPANDDETAAPPTDERWAKLKELKDNI